MMITSGGFVYLLLSSLFAATVAQDDVLRFVDPLIGTVKLGHVFGGASLPYGMAKAVSDVTDNNRGGFAGDGINVSGFSHMHDSGTGGASSMGNFPLFPYAGCEGDDPDGCAPFVKRARAVGFNRSSVTASPGYFSVQLDTKVVGEMTVTARTALYRFNFPDDPDAANASLKPLIILDLTDLYDSRSSGSVTVDEATGGITAEGTFKPGFGDGNYRSYACVDFAGADILSSGTWTGQNTNSTNRSLKVSSQKAGAFVHFDEPHNDNQIIARVGLSFKSTSLACQNAENELPDFGAAFDATRRAAENEWSKKLSVIDIRPGGVSDALQTNFWSGVYRTMISPQDYTGENPLWESDEPYYDSFYCIWDSFRTTHPFLTIVDTEVQSKMVRSLIDIYRHQGYLPDCRMQLSKGYTQGGSNAEVVMADSYLKGLGGPIDWETAYQGMVKDAEVMPPEWLVEGRGHLENYKKLGYVPKDDDGGGYGLRGASVSRNVEYAYDDFCIAVMAKPMGKEEDYKKYIGRSSNWRNQFDVNSTSTLNNEDTGFVGFLQPRLMNGDFDFQEPSRGAPANNVNCCGMFSADIETYEGSSWMYTFFVPGDMAALVEALGGPETFVRRLDYMHEKNLVDIGDEQAFLTPFQYHYAGRPGRSAYRIRQYIPKTFNTAQDGLPGNDDGGAMGAFIAFSMMGLYPNAGQNVYLIMPPFFESVSITNPQTGKTATIKNKNFDPTDDAIYIQSATLNGAPYTKNWIDHSFFLEGGTLELVLGTEEGDWGTAESDLPPSLSTTGIYYGEVSQGGGAFGDTKPQDDKPQDDKLQDDKSQDDKLQDDKLQDDKLQDDKLQDDKLQDDKLQDDKLLDDKLHDDKASHKGSRPHKGASAAGLPNPSFFQSALFYFICMALTAELLWLGGLFYFGRVDNSYQRINSVRLGSFG